MPALPANKLEQLHAGIQKISCITLTVINMAPRHVTVSLPGKHLKGLATARGNFGSSQVARGTIEGGVIGTIEIDAYEAIIGGIGEKGNALDLLNRS